MSPLQEAVACLLTGRRLGVGLFDVSWQHSPNARERAMRTLAIALCVVMSATGSAAWADCDISKFQESDVGSQNSAEFYSYLSRIEKDEWNSDATRAGASGKYKGSPFSTNYSRMQEYARRELSNLGIQVSSNQAESWARSSLSDNGLKAYLRCRGGFDVSMADLSAGLGKIYVTSHPGLNVLVPRPKIVSHSNIANIKQIAGALAAATFGPSTVELGLSVRKIASGKGAHITLQAGNEAKTAYLPAPAPSERREILSIRPRVCSSGGNYDDRDCVLIDQFWVAAKPSEIRLMANLSDFKISKLKDPAVNDPHRQGFFRMWCGTQKIEEYIGQTNQETAVRMQPLETMSCRARAGEQVRVALVLTPRGGSEMSVGAGSTFWIREVHH